MKKNTMSWGNSEKKTEKSRKLEKNN